MNVLFFCAFRSQPRPKIVFGVLSFAERSSRASKVYIRLSLFPLHKHVHPTVHFVDNQIIDFDMGLAS